MPRPIAAIISRTLRTACKPAAPSHEHRPCHKRLAKRPDVLAHMSLSTAVMANLSTHNDSLPLTQPFNKALCGGAPSRASQTLQDIQICVRRQSRTSRLSTCVQRTSYAANRDGGGRVVPYSIFAVIEPSAMCCESDQFDEWNRSPRNISGGFLARLRRNSTPTIRHAAGCDELPSLHPHESSVGP